MAPSLRDNRDRKQELVATQLDGLGYIPVSITEEREGIFSPEFLQQFTRITPQDQIIFSRQLATLISAGLPFYWKL